MAKYVSKFSLAFMISSGLGSIAQADIENYVEPIQPEDCTTFLTSGEASWYGEEVAKGYDENGNPIFDPTKSGEVFNPDLLTAAFPDKQYLGRYFLVKGLGKNVIVRVNDKGPSAKDKHGNPRVIDLAEAAGKRLGMDGTANVQVFLCNKS